MTDVSTSGQAVHAGRAPEPSRRFGPYRAVVFDWDGTLMDSTHHIVGSLIAACRDLGLHEPSAQEAGWVIGLSLQSALYRLVPELSAGNVDAFVDRYRVHFQQLQNEMVLFDGQAALLRELHARGVVLGVATGKSRRGLDVAIDRLGLQAVFDATRCADEARGKPDPDMLEQLLAEWGLAPGDVLMVGDTTHDVRMAQAARVDSLAVAYGAHSLAELESTRPSALARTVPDMQAWVRAHARSPA